MTTRVTIDYDHVILLIDVYMGALRLSGLLALRPDISLGYG
jgi:hypothetical protein